MFMLFTSIQIFYRKYCANAKLEIFFKVETTRRRTSFFSTCGAKFESFVFKNELSELFYEL